MTASEIRTFTLKVESHSIDRWVDVIETPDSDKLVSGEKIEVIEKKIYDAVVAREKDLESKIMNLTEGIVREVNIREKKLEIALEALHDIKDFCDRDEGEVAVEALAKIESVGK